MLPTPYRKVKNMQKTFYRLVFVFALLLSLPGCQMITPAVVQEASPTAASTDTPAPLPPTPSPAPSLVLSSQLIEEKSSEIPKYEIKLQYPMLEWGGDPRVQAFNQAAERIATEEMRSFKEGVQSTVNDPNVGDFPSSLEMGHTVTYSENGLISVIFKVGYYMAGAAHPGYYSHTINYDIGQGRVLALEDLFQPDATYLETLSAFSLDDLKKRGVLEWEDGALPKPESYQNWNVTPNGLIITFDEYMVSSHAAGAQTVIVPFAAIQNIIRSDGALAWAR